MDDNYIKLENYEMLKALYDFKATFAKTLSFRENDHFILHQTNTKQRNWWQVVNNTGQLGYIPSNYVTTVKVQPQFMIDFLEECIEKLRSEFVKPGAPLPIDKQDLVQRLVEKKRQAESSRKPKKPAPLPPTFSSTSPIKETPITTTVTVSSSSSASSVAKPDAERSTPSASHAGAKSFLPDGEIQKIPDFNRRNSNSNIDSRRSSFPRQSELAPKSSELGFKSSEVGSRSSEPIPRSIEPVPRVPEQNIRGPESNSRVTDSEKPILIRQTSRQSPTKSSQNNSTSFEIDSRAAYKLLDEVRKNTQLSYEMSKLAVTVVVSGLQQLLPSSISHYFDTVLNQLQMPLINSKMRIEDTYDSTRLKIIFDELTSCKEDSQQRSWMLYEDESIIVEYIKELTSILTNADASVSRHALKQDQYNGIITLIEYYQMEARWTIRQLLLQSFGVMCSLDPVVVTIMLNSILPMELARDMTSNPRNVPKLNYSSLLMTMIFSMAEPMPITHLEYLGCEFIAFLLDGIEDPPDTDLEDQIPDLFTNLILAYNLQFNFNATSNSNANVNENIFMMALRERTNAKIFTQKILFLLNREEDPVRIFDHQPAPMHSVLKLFIDIFSMDITASLFYTNDIKVLIDIVLRQLFDIPPGDKRRLYLELCRRVLRTTGYDDHRHRSEDLLKCFTRIFCEEGPESQGDQKLIREISNEFPSLFKM
ncbi:NCK-interacting protein with SH3 domain [Microplitis mediator]|uniref:NCK-interacting protein with SH3 domain n=1 Tax=Microplitis mediator TaxID=375433 RepID=UPI002554D766|nr:NCK-interacting protein with SH3 domain [Microplitis mediator]